MTTGRPQDERTPTLGTVAAALALALGFALWVDFSKLHRLHDSDSLLPVFVSLQSWRPFYWGQNRFGMLLPLLSLPFRTPLANLLVEVGLRLAAIAGACLVLARSIAPPRAWLSTGTLLLAGFVALGGLPELAAAQKQPYPLEILLGLGGALLIERRRNRLQSGLGVVAVLLAGWVSLTLALWLIPLLLLRRWLSDAEMASGPAAPAVLTVLASAAVNLVVSRFYVTHGTDYALAPLASWLGGFTSLGGQAIASVWPLWAIAAGFVLARLTMWKALPRWDRRWQLRGSAILIATALLHLLALSASAWVAANGYLPRYSLASRWMLILVPILAISASVEAIPANRMRGLAVAALAVVLLLIAGPPSFERPPEALARWSVAAAEIRALECTHVVGDYWRSWPVVFTVLSERHRALGPPWALSDRSLETERQWRPVNWSQARICGFAADTERARLVADLHLPPLEVVSTHGDVELLRAAETRP